MAPEDVVRRMGAVQSQDYPGAKWAIALRAEGLTDADVERAHDEGRILRTHVLRPTWHFVTREDIGWMLALSAPRIRTAMRAIDRQLGLDEALLSRVRRRLERVFRDGRPRTRPDIASDLARGGIDVRGQRLWHVLVHAELDGLVCSGPRRGKELTYARFETRAREGGTIDRDEALATLARRYFLSHGPATAADFAWWSGLAMGDARRAIDIVRDGLASMACDGTDYLVDASTPSSRRRRLRPRLLPNFDEYAVAYKDRRTLVHAKASGIEPGMGLLSQGLVLAGRFAGTWTRIPLRGGFRLDIDARVALSAAEGRAIAAEVERYARFIGMPTHHRVSMAS
jgi:hypothetical protein